MTRTPLVRRLLELSPQSELAHAAAVGVMIWLGAGRVETSSLIAWGTTVLGLQLIRLLLRISMMRRGVAAAHAIRVFRMTVLLIGIAWGAAVLPLWTQLPFDFFVVSVLAYCLLLGAAVVAFGADAETFYLFTTPTMAPVLLALATTARDKQHWVLFAMVVVYVVTMVTLYRREHQALCELSDMSERMQASEQQFRQLTENIPEVFFVSEADISRILYVSPAYEHVWEQSAEGLYRNPRSFLEPVHPDDVRRVAESIERVRRGESVEVEFRLVLGDGTVRSILNRVGPVRDEEGVVYRIAGVARDVTEQRAAREAEQRAREEADRIAAAKMAFLANMSHEIRTPMSGILGMAELLRDTALTADQHRSVEVITSSAEGLLGILNDILDLSKIEAGELTLESVPFDLPALVDSTARLLAVSAFERGVELVSDCDDDVPQIVRGDPGRLRQVLTNLLGNAVKFTDEGEVELHVRVADQEADQVVIEFAVRDTGIGIASEQLQRIFAPFGQADTSTTRKYGGTGLGLSISRRLVRLMGSDISVKSRVGRGSTFWFRLVFAVETWTADAIARQPRRGLQQVRTLVVDDNVTNRRVLGGLLRHAGADAAEVGNVAEAMAALRQAVRDGHPYQLLVSDVNMPMRDGFGLAEDIRSDPTLGDIRLMLLTSAAEPGDGDRCRRLGVAAYLQKPVSRVELVESAIAAMSDAPLSGDPPPLVTRHSIEQARRPLHILLAEDNVVNQDVAAAMLRRRGHMLDIVKNGRQAVEAVRAGSYDLILMDIQMPELDGLEATREIREYLGDRPLPIIALTADAMPGERERCLAGGMDDYLAKPFKAFQLFAAVEGWRSGPDSTAAEQSAPGGRAPPVDIAGFRADLRSAGIEETLERMLAQYRSDAPARLAAIEEAVMRRDAKGMQRAAHAFKSSAGTIRATTLAALLGDMEGAARAGDVEAAAAQIARVREEHAAVETCLAAAAREDP